MNLYEEWLAVKRTERAAQEARRAIEDEMAEQLELSAGEGSKTYKRGNYKVKVTQRYNRTIDSDLLQEIAAEHGISEHLPSLFRWKPDINARAWGAASDEITRPLLDAITTKPGRPSFAIEQEEIKS